MANVSRVFQNEKYVDALLEGGLIGKGEDGLYYIGDNGADFCFNVYAEMANELITNHNVPEAFRARLIKNMGNIAPAAFEKIYKNFKVMLDHNKAAWCGPLIMVLLCAEPMRDPNLTLKHLCDLFEFFHDWTKQPPTMRIMH